MIASAIHYRLETLTGQTDDAGQLLCVDPLGNDARHAVITGLKPARPEADGVEFWTSSSPVSYGEAAGVLWSEVGQELFLSTVVDEADGLRQGTRDAYERLLLRLQGSGLEPCRIWNCISDINEDSEGTERYKLFNLGRLDAFDAFNVTRFPAASALGGERTVIYLQASAAPQLDFENPRQVSAFEYPDQYGPVSPSFSRATVVEYPSTYRAYVSGTASIVGHETRHVGDVSRQLETTVANLELLRERFTERYGVHFGFSLLRVFVRRQTDLERVVAGVEAAFPEVPARYYFADVCRRELLVEIEAMAEGARA